MGPPYFTGLRGGLFHISPLCQRSMLDFNPCNSFIGSYGSGYNIGLQREEALWHTTVRTDAVNKQKTPPLDLARHEILIKNYK